LEIPDFLLTSNSPHFTSLHFTSLHLSLATSRIAVGGNDMLRGEKHSKIEVGVPKEEEEE
jgi:hypothetical protein